MNYRHKELAAGRWFGMSLVEQLANAGSEVERALKWRDKGNRELSDQAVERALELLTLTIIDPRHRTRLRELTRVRETLADFFYGGNRYGGTAAGWRNYFGAFAYAARATR
jgi:hypothetical protein